MSYINRLESAVLAQRRAATDAYQEVDGLSRYLQSEKFRCGDELDSYVNTSDVLVYCARIQEALVLSIGMVDTEVICAVAEKLGEKGRKGLMSDQIVSEYAKGWNGRGNLRELVVELERQKDATFDFVADTRDLGVAVDQGRALLVPSSSANRRVGEWVTSEGLPISDTAIAQLGSRMEPNVPTKFLRSMISDRPDLASHLLTGLLHATAKQNLVRVLDDRVRAFLSDRYQPLDNYTLAFKALDVAKQVGGQVFECSLSESRMLIKFMTKELFEVIAKVREDDPSGKWYSGGLGNQEYLSKVGARSIGELPGGPGAHLPRHHHRQQ